MKSVILFYILLHFNIYFVDGNFLNFGSFFRSSGSLSGTTTATTTSQPLKLHLETQLPEDEERSDEDSAESVEYKAESDSYLYNSSSEQEFMNDSGTLNSTSANDHLIEFNASNNALDSVPISSKDSTEFKGSELHPGSDKTSTSGVSSTTERQTTSNIDSTSPAASTEGNKISSANITTDEKEGVIRGTEETFKAHIPKTFIQKTLDWVEDEYTLSILVPITAGIVFALTIIITIATCRCIRRCCRRRRFRKKILPESVKNLRPSDRARLLGDFNSSDDEF